MKRKKENSMLGFVKTHRKIIGITIVSLVFLIGIIGLLFGFLTEENGYIKILEENGYTEIKKGTHIPISSTAITDIKSFYFGLSQTQEEKIAEEKYGDINSKSVEHALSMNSFSGAASQREGVLLLYYSLHPSSSPFTSNYQTVFVAMAKVAIEDPFIKGLIMHGSLHKDNKTVKEDYRLINLLGEEDLQNLRQEYNSATTEIQREKILAKYESMTLKNGILYENFRAIRGNPNTEIYAIILDN